MTEGTHLLENRKYVGRRNQRVEDDQLLRADGCYVADINVPGTLELVVVRSPHAHARVVGVDAAAAREASGVAAVVTAEDLTDVAPFPDTNALARPVRAFPLARERVRYVGAPIAAVVADDRYLAEDAAELVVVEYEELPIVVSTHDALSGVTRLYDEWDDNRMVSLPASDDDVDAIFRESRIVRQTFSVHRHTAVPIETRGCLASYEHGRLTVWTSTQSPHIVRTILAKMLPVKEHEIRVITPDVGGAFGCKSHVYPEEVLAAWLALRLRRPVRFIEDRAEHMTATSHAREQTLEMEAALAPDGQIIAIRSHIVADVGSGEIWFPGVGPSVVAAGAVTGPYKIDRAVASITCLVTNKTPSGAYRGFGAPEAAYALERLVDMVAREADVDRVELRRRMLFTQEDLPVETPGGSRIEEGTFREAFDHTVKLANEAYSEALVAYNGDATTRIGVGYASYVEGTAPSYFLNTGHWGAHDSCSIRVEPDGSVVVGVGVTTSGQGVKSMVASLAADALGVTRDSVRVDSGDTEGCPQGTGSWGSRSTVVGGGAVLKAAGRVREKVLAIASHVLEADLDDLHVQDGQVTVRGDRRAGVSIAEVATIASIRTFELPAGMEGGLFATAMYEPPGVDPWPDDNNKMNACAAWANATHAAIVRVDIETGEVEVVNYVATHDCGRVINPMIVEGQVAGGIAQGIGGALYEVLPYTSQGQPQFGSFADYLLPSATEIPPMLIEHFETPARKTPLGVKGVGEGGVIGGLGAIANAVSHALAEFGIEIVATPITPALVRGLIRQAKQG